MKSKEKHVRDHMDSLMAESYYNASYNPWRHTMSSNKAPLGNLYALMGILSKLGVIPVSLSTSVLLSFITQEMQEKK